ncbi:MAG: LPS export ABC transporter periplasmic protein LptC [Candidatus Omnitrophica bacterium]|nr:LPS export ABC transporter periplasmic protein LptC [Candidatus Omnitrophota bacterium]
MRLYLILLIIFFFCSCAKKEDASMSTLKEDEEGLMQAMEEVYFQETEEGKKRYEVWANSLDIFPGKKLLKKVRFKFYRESDILYLKGDEAEIADDGDIDLNGNVSGKSDQGIEFTTDHLFWEDGEEMLSTESPVKLMSESIYVTGVGLETTPKLEEARIKSNVYVTFFQNITDDVPMVITAETLNVRFGDNPKATFEGDVVVKDSQVEIHSKRLIIKFSPDGRRVEESMAQGEVVIVTDELEAECGEATLLNKEKKIILEADPIVWHKKVKCRGERITYLQEEKRVVVEKNIKGIFLPKSIDNISNDSIK